MRVSIDIERDCNNSYTDGLALVFEDGGAADGTVVIRLENPERRIEVKKSELRRVLKFTLD